MQAVVGGNEVYPNLTEIANLFRAQINDTANNTGGSGTGSGTSAGLIMPNSNPDLITFISSALRTLFSDLRNVGSPELIVDNYILTGLPALTQQDATVQVGLGYAGFFDGFQWHANWTLPVGARRILGLWERENGADEDFIPMQFQPFGLPGVLQGRRMRLWETRQGIVWMPGCTLSTDLRVRARISFPSTYNVNSLDFDTTYVPILNCGDAVAAKMLVRYAMRFAPDMLAAAKQEEKDQMDKLYLETVRQLQEGESMRSEFGGEAVVDFAIAWGWL